MELILGVTNDVPVPNALPPVGVAYQLNVPALPVDPSVTVPVPQRLPGVVPVMVGTVFIVAVTAVREDVHEPETAST